MTIQDLGALGELVGSVAVLATLVYLALQTRQNTMAIAAQLDAVAVATAQNSQLLAATSDGLVAGLREDSRSDFTRLDLYWGSLLNVFHWQRLQARRGLLPSFNERTVEACLISFFRNQRSFERWWEGWKGFFPSEFVEFVEQQRAKAA